MPQRLMYVEFGATDVPRAARFYSDIFGWSFADLDAARYSTFSSGPGGISGGIYQTDSVRPGGGIILYVAVDDTDAYGERIGAGGGAIVQKKEAIPETGWYALFSDPDGNVLGLFTQHPDNKKTY